MAIKIGTVNADTSVKLGTTTIQSGYIGFNEFYNKYTSILDLYPSAYHAYSLRKLKNTYSGFCLRVRRTTTTPSVTTTTVNVNFDVFNTISLSSKITYASGAPTNAKCLGEFCASIVNGYTNPDGVNTNQNIFVTTWYDQSGNNKNIAQATLSAQPRLVNLGNLEIVDGSVGVRFTSASNQFLSITDTSTFYNNMSCYAVGNSLSATVNTSIYGQGANANNARLFLPLGTNIVYNTTNTFPITGITANVDRLYELVCGTSTTSAYSNGIQSSVASVPSISVTNIYIAIGTNSAVPAVYMNGHIKEVLCFIGTPLRTDIENNINSYYNVW
jgi:hypothetical protein